MVPIEHHQAASFRAMTSRLDVRTTHPTHLPKPSSPLSRHLPRYWRRFMTLMRPSIPARNLLALLYHPCPSYSSCFSLFFPLWAGIPSLHQTPLSAARCLWSVRCGPPPPVREAYRTGADDPPRMALAELHHRHCPPE